MASVRACLPTLSFCLCVVTNFSSRVCAPSQWWITLLPDFLFISLRSVSPRDPWGRRVSDRFLLFCRVMHTFGLCNVKWVIKLTSVQDSRRESACCSKLSETSHPPAWQGLSLSWPEIWHHCSTDRQLIGKSQVILCYLLFSSEEITEEKHKPLVEPATTLVIELSIL
jgi:hypothetical protein